MGKRPARKQLSLIQETDQKSPKTFGGSALRSNPKIKRPINTKMPLHLVLKARRALGRRSMLHPSHTHAVDRCVRAQAKRHGVRIYQYVNMGNHLHLLIRLKNRTYYHAFIRSISGLIARIILKKERGDGTSIDRNSAATFRAKSSFWLARPFSRIASWGRDFAGLKRYIEKNRKQLTSSSIGTNHLLSTSVVEFDANSGTG